LTHTVETNMKLIVSDISSFEIFKTVDFMTSTSLSMRTTVTVHTGKHCVKISSYSDHNYQRRSILKMQTDRQTNTLTDNNGSLKKGKKGRALDIAPQVDMATTEALRYMVRTKQRRTYLPYTFPTVAGTHLPTPRGWRVE